MSSKKFSKLRHEELTFFVDRSLGKEPLASSLRELGFRVELHDDHFPQDAPDSVWLEVVGRRGWVVLSKDKHIRYRPMEREMVREHRCRLFVLTGGSLNSKQIADIFVRTVHKIAKLSQQHPAPFLAHVTRAGRVSTPQPIK